MSTGNDKLDQRIARVASAMSGYLVREFAASVRKKKIKVTGEFEGSFDSRVNEINGGFVVIVRMKAYGNILTRSKVFWTKPANSDALEKWVRKVGVDYFSYIPGVGGGEISDEKAARRIANAIAFQRFNGSKRREYGKMRAQNWKRQPLGIGKAYAKHLIRESVAQLVQQEVVNALSTK